mmetsp:Transcript_23734/g.33184  ORF Transcript_23734/g.33184 Transcript_23734/m.33184 type:complete len:168 (-) Transcript_23734:132-635(-)
MDLKFDANAESHPNPSSDLKPSLKPRTHFKKNKREEKALCEICEQTPHKYKCSGCRMVYCGVKCFKVHKTLCSIQRKPQQIHQRNDVRSARMSPPQLCPSLETQELKRLHESSYVRQAVQNLHLREVIARVDTGRGEDRARLLKHEMRINLEFRDFVDKMIAEVKVT